VGDGKTKKKKHWERTGSEQRGEKKRAKGKTGGPDQQKKEHLFEKKRCSRKGGDGKNNGKKLRGHCQGVEPGAETGIGAKPQHAGKRGCKKKVSTEKKKETRT